MAILKTQGISQYYEVFGNPTNPPVLLVAGLGGTGKSWITQINRFAKDYYVIVPDHRGTGQSTHTIEGHTTQQLATDMASLLEYLDVGQVHVVGSSTGGAIAQYMALDYPDMIRSLTLTSTFARFDAFMQRQFEVRRKMAYEWDRYSTLSGYSLFLFSPRYTRENPDSVAAWIDRAAAQATGPVDKEIAVKRIDMIAAHDTLSRLSDIYKPTLVLCGDRNLCTPLPLSEEIVKAMPKAELVIFQDAGELIEIEKADEFFENVNDFIKRHQ